MDLGPIRTQDDLISRSLTQTHLQRLSSEKVSFSGSSGYIFTGAAIQLPRPSHSHPLEHQVIVSKSLLPRTKGPNPIPAPEHPAPVSPSQATGATNADGKLSVLYTPASRKGRGGPEVVFPRGRPVSQTPDLTAAGK